GGEISGPGNAFVGVYLASLGMSGSAIHFITETKPDTIAWLSEADAREHEISAIFVDHPGGRPSGLPPLAFLAFPGLPKEVEAVRREGEQATKEAQSLFRLAGSCRAYGGRIVSLTGRGSENAVVRGVRGRIESMAECYRQSGGEDITTRR